MPTSPSGYQHWIAGLPFSTGTSFAGRLAKDGGNLVLFDDGVGFVALGDTKPLRLIPYAEIQEVTAYADQPPRLRIVPSTGKPLVVMVGWKRWTSPRSKDNSARDEAVAAIRARVSRSP